MKSKRQKKKFSCGHKGYGEYCHYCKQVQDGTKLQKKGGEYEKI